MNRKSICGSVAAGLVASALVVAPALAAINAGDQLNIRVFNHPELSGSPKVDSRGFVSVPVIGSVRVQGLQSSEVAKLLKERLTPYVPFPAVDVTDASESSVVFVAGGPGGVVSFAPGETLATALADVEKELQRNQAGAATSTNTTDQIDRSRIDIRRVIVLRDGKVFGSFDMQALRRNGNPGPALFANDTVSFADKPIQVTMLGDVVTPGKAYLWADEPLSDALSQAGGLQDSAATGRVQFDRAGDTPQLIALGDQAFSQPAQPGDTLNFPTAPRVTVAGMVYTPGVATLKNNFTLLSAMYTAGGIQKWANLKDVQVTHAGTTTHYDVTQLTHGNETQNPMLADGDTVFVPEGHKLDFTQVFAALGLGNVILR